jgi:tRNA modification GTPase
MFVEAAIDFPEEEIDFIQQEKVFTQITALLTQLQSIQQTAKQGALLREGIRVVIAGQPNVGKSSLLNALSGKEIAIVTDIAGTTRDVLRQEINLDGLPLHIIDTAGLRESNDPVEQEGIRRARQEIQQADQLIVIVDAAQTKNINITELVASLQLPVDLNRQIMLIRNKIDLTAELPEIAKHQSYTVINLSVKTQQGLDLLRNQLKNNCGFAPATESQFLARRRHIDAIQRAEQSLQNATQQKATELIAEELRQAQQALGEITGEFTSDALLGRIFSEFCIGK